MQSSDMEKVTDTLARFIGHTELKNIPHETIETAKGHIVDTMGVLCAGSNEKITGIIKEYIQSLGCREECTLLTQGIKTSAQYAAFGNGVIAHALDFDDYESFSMAHSSVTILPAVLALGERLQASGKECLEAYLVGIEVISKIGRGVNPNHYEKGWHSTSTLGTLGASSASSKLLKLDPEKTRMTLGIAASMASGLRGNFGTMTKPFHAGHAARSGVESAGLATLGFTADKNILENDLGFCNVFTEKNEYDLKKITTDLGSPFSITFPGIGKKLFPSCAATHSCLDGIFHLINQYDIRAKDVDHVECGIYYLSKNILIHSNPQTGLEGKFSLEFCIALALQERKVSIAQFTDEKVKEPEIQDLLKRVKKTVNDELGGRGTEYPGAIVKVYMKNGETYSHKVENRKGSPANPLSTDEIQNKFMDCVQLKYSREKAYQILEAVMNLEKQEDISKLVRLIS